jgi:23S rRNA (guanine745-N1)-methyltransferase
MAWDLVAPCLVCPLCRGRLARAGAALRCAAGHAFDVAREGYVNLLVTSRRLPRLVGDSKEMLLARRRFLEREHYRPLSDAISAIAARHLDEAARCSDSHGAPPVPPAPAASGALCVVDLGCGDGYYLGRLSGHAGIHRGARVFYVGLDVARDAARLAARRYRDVDFAVADVRAGLPCADASVHLLLNVFAPRNPPEFGRIAAPEGLLLVVIPTPDHLAQVRAAVPLLRIHEDKQRHVLESFDRLFDCTGRTTIAYEVDLTADELVDLVQMSPSARHLSAADIEAIQRLQRLRTTIGFDLLAFRRRGVR